MSNISNMPRLKRPPTYGVFRWWPENGESWIHPFDIGIVRRLVPGTRVFRREDLDEKWLLVAYGNIRFRVRSTIWYEVEFEGFNIGDYVEVKSRMGKADPFVGYVRHMNWNHRYKRIEYTLDRSDITQVRAYVAEDLTIVDPIQPGEELRIERSPGDRQFVLRPLENTGNDANDS
jgi:hypothetical protein